MRTILIIILLGGIVLLGAFSCATMPKEPLASGEVRLLSISVPGTVIFKETSFPVNIFFEAVGNPQIERACFSESEVEPYCLDVSGASYTPIGGKRAFQVYLPGLSSGSYTVECYAEYFRDGAMRKTNMVFTQISVGGWK